MGPARFEIVATLRDTFTGERDVERFVRALVFNWVLGGTDAHEKRYGLLLDGTSARLAPLCGVASAAVLDERERSRREMAMQIDGEGRSSSLTGDRWRRFCSRAGVPFELAADTGRQYAEGLGDKTGLGPNARSPWVESSRCHERSL